MKMMMESWTDIGQSFMNSESESSSMCYTFGIMYLARVNVAWIIRNIKVVLVSNP